MYRIDITGNVRSEFVKDSYVVGTTYAHQEKAEAEFIDFVMEEMSDVYLTQPMSLQDVELHAHRLKNLAHTLRRFNCGEIKKARFDFRESTFVLKKEN